MTQEQFVYIAKFKMAYISTIEDGDANLTLKNIDIIANSLSINLSLLFDEQTAEKAKHLPKRVDMYIKNKD